MDRYLCKAKRIDNGEWVEGYQVPIVGDKDGVAILTEVEWHEFYEPDLNGFALVDQSTLCQCTGKRLWETHRLDTDDEGVLIYEGDRIKGKFGFYSDGAFHDGEIEGVVKYVKNAWWVDNGITDDELLMLGTINTGMVIGNIHDESEVANATNNN